MMANYNLFSAFVTGSQLEPRQPFNDGPTPQVFRFHAHKGSQHSEARVHLVAQPEAAGPLRATNDPYLTA